MFALSAKRLLAWDNFLIRSFITGTKFEYPRGNPGIENRLKAFRQDGIKIREDNVEEYIEESESSFYNVCFFFKLSNIFGCLFSTTYLSLSFHGIVSLKARWFSYIM